MESRDNCLWGGQEGKIGVGVPLKDAWNKKKCVLLMHCQNDGDGLEVKDEIQSVLF